MRQNPSFAMTDVAELRRLIDANPWMTLVSATDDGLVASHYAVLLDEDRDDLTIVGHVGRARRPHPRSGRARAPRRRAGSARLHLARLVRRRRERADLELRLGAPHRHPGAAHARGEPARARAPRRAIRERDAAAPPDVGAAERPRLRHEARARHGRLPAHPDEGGRQAQAQPEQAGRGRSRRSSPSSTRATAPTPTRGSPPRCSARSTRGRPRGEPRSAASPSPSSRTSGSPAVSGRDPFGDDPVDVHLADGVHRRHRPGRRPGPRGAVLDAGGAWLIPGLWDHHVHIVQWALAAQRAAARRGRPAAARGARSWATRPCSPTAAASAPASATRSGRTRRRSRCSTPRPASVPTYLINADVHSVWLNTAALRREGFEPDEIGHPARGARVRDLAPAQRRRRRRSRTRSSPRWRRMPRPAASSGSSTSTWRGTRRPGRAASPAASTLLRVEFGIYPQFLDRAIAEGLRTGDPVRGRGIRSRPRRTAQGHHRRVARHPHGRVLARLPGRPAQPRAAHGRSGDARRAHDARDRRGTRRRRSTRSATSRTRTRSTRSPSRARGARSSTRSSSRTPTSRDSRRLGVVGERAARARDRRPRHHRHDLGRPDRAALPAARARRHRREPAVRLGRARLAARSVGGDGGRGVPHPRRPRAVAAAAGASTPRPPSPPRRTAARPTARRIEPGARRRPRALSRAIRSRRSEPELRGDDRRGDAARRTPDAPGLRTRPARGASPRSDPGGGRMPQPGVAREAGWVTTSERTGPMTTITADASRHHAAAPPAGGLRRVVEAHAGQRALPARRLRARDDLAERAGHAASGPASGLLDPRDRPADHRRCSLLVARGSASPTATCCG